MRRDAGLGAEQPVEMRARQAGGARDRIQFDLRARAFGHQPDRLAHAEIGDGGRSFLHRLTSLPAFVVADVYQVPELAIERVQRRRAADQRRRSLDLFIEGWGALEMRAAEAQAMAARRI